MSTTAGSSSIHTDGDAIHFDLQAVAANPIVGSVPTHCWAMRVTRGNLSDKDQPAVAVHIDNQ